MQQKQTVFFKTGAALLPLVFQEVWFVSELNQVFSKVFFVNYSQPLVFGFKDLFFNSSVLSSLRFLAAWFCRVFI